MSQCDQVCPEKKGGNRPKSTEIILRIAKTVRQHMQKIAYLQKKSTPKMKIFLLHLFHFSTSFEDSAPSESEQKQRNYLQIFGNSIFSEIARSAPNGRISASETVLSSAL